MTETTTETNYFALDMPGDNIRSISNLGLAHLGDAVFEVMVRSWLCLHGKATPKGLHKATVHFVAAPAQAAAVQKILPILSEEEGDVYRRGRNASPNFVPKAATREQYQMATALEALFGYLYLQGKTDRLNQLFAIMMEDA